MASIRLESVAFEIKMSVQNYVDNSDAFTVTSLADDSRSHYHRYQIVEAAKQLKYFANLRNYHSLIQLVINVETSIIILLSFHVLGREYRGLLVCYACAYHKNNTEENEYNISENQVLTDTLFQFSYADEENNLRERFGKWLEEVVVTGLEYWNKSL